MAESTPTHEVEVNLFYLHYRDAEALAERAVEEKTKLRSLYVRHAVLAVIFASEALINRLLSRVPLSKLEASGVERLGPTEKWSLVPFLVSGRPDTRAWLDTSREPFQSFLELVRIRNWLVHPKPGEFISAVYDGRFMNVLTESDFDDDESLGKPIPWVEALSGDVWPQTKLPVNPFEWEGSHAKSAIRILDLMLEELRKVLGDLLSSEWIWEIDLKSARNGATSRITVESLWGGYTPNGRQGG